MGSFGNSNFVTFIKFKQKVLLFVKFYAIFCIAKEKIAQMNYFFKS